MIEEDRIQKSSWIQGEIDSDSYKSHSFEKTSSNIEYLVDLAISKHRKRKTVTKKFKNKIPLKKILPVTLIVLLIIAILPYLLTPLYGDFSNDLRIDLNPNNGVYLNDTLFINLTIPINYNITRVSADIAGVETIDLLFVSNDSAIQFWQSVWFVHSLNPGNHVIEIIAFDNLNVSYHVSIGLNVFTDYISTPPAEEPGSSEVNVSDNDTQKPDFDNINISINDSKTSTGFNLSFVSDKSSYVVNEKVSINGVVFFNNSVVNGSLDLSIHNNGFNSSDIVNISEGKFEYEFIPFNPGDYFIKVNISNEIATIEESIIIYVEKLLIKNTTENISEITIIDPEIKEEVFVVPGSSFYVERTIDGPNGLQAVFAPLFSNGLTIERIEIVDGNATGDRRYKEISNITEGEFVSGQGESYIERRIDNLRKQLPLDTKDLDIVAYSDVFVLHEPITIRIWFRAPSWERIISGQSPTSGRISYLTFAGDNFDFEGSTWWNSSWGFRKLITVDSSQVEADLTNFPMLVYNSSDSHLANYAQDDGDDISFVLYSDNSTQLNHEIALYNNTTGQLAAWVNITSLSSSIDTKIWMYYNNSACSSQENIAGTWDSNYEIIWHLQEEGDGTTDEYNDSSNNACHGTGGKDDDSGGLGDATETPDRVNGKFGYAQDFNVDGATGDRISSQDLSSTWTAVTGSIWINGNAAGDDRIWGKSWGTGSTDNTILMRCTGTGGSTLGCRFRTDTSSTGGYQPTSMENDAWIYMVLTWDGSDDDTIRIYKDGTLQGSGLTVSGSTLYGSPPHEFFTLGNVGDGANDRCFDGYIQEARMSSILRNYSWITTEYNNQNNLTTFLSFSGPDTDNPPILELINPSPNGTTNVDIVPSCSIWANDTDGDTLTVYWYENTTGSYILRNTNSSVSANSSVSYSFSEFDNYSRTYYWKTAVNDTENNITEWYSFTTKTIQTSVDTITPYIQTSSPITINSTGDTNLDNVTLWYRYSTNNASWDDWIVNITDPVLPWQWTFNFQNGTGYYEFYSIGNKSGSPNESAPGSADAICEYNITYNFPPTIGLINPSPNGSTDIGLLPICKIWANDSEGDTLTIYWYENSTGSWILRNTNSSTTANSSVNYSFSQFNSYSTTYYWKVAVNDSTNNKSDLFLFTTRPLNYEPNIELINPSPNGTTGIDVLSDCSIWVNDTDGDPLTVYWYENSTGSYVLRNTNNSITANSTVSYSFSEFNDFSNIYYWKVVVNDSIDNESAWFYFTTKPLSLLTSVDAITPYNETVSPKIITTTGSVGLDNVSLWYQFSTNNFSWWNESWGYRKLITVDSSQVEADLTNFPMLIYNTSDTNLANYAQPDGDDIAFILFSDNTTQLNHEIALYNNTTGQLAAWVNITSLSSSIDTKIWMYYNNSACSSQENVAGTWDSNYEIIWHLQEEGDGTTDEYNDSSNNACHGTGGKDDDSGGLGDATETPDRVNGKFGYAQDFNVDGATGDRISSQDLSSTWTAVTGSIWINGNAAGDDRIWGKSWGTGSTDNTILMRCTGTGGSTLGCRFRTDTSSTGGYQPTSMENDAWIYMVLTWDGSDDDTIRIYKDGTLQGSGLTVSGSTLYGSPPHEFFTLGNVGDGANDRCFDGYIQEARMSSILRNYSWITTEFNNQNNLTTFLSFDDYEKKNFSWMLWNNAANPDTSSPWSWSFDFPNGTGYYEFYSIGNKSGSPNESSPISPDAICRYIPNSLPTQNGESPINGSLNIQLTPFLFVNCSDADTSDTLNATWWSNSSGTWQQFGSNNTSFASGTNISQDNSNFSSYSTTYWWSVNVTDGEGGWKNVTYHFTSEPIAINTSADTIIPYTITSSILNVTATNYTQVDNITLYYRWSLDNFTTLGTGKDGAITISATNTVINNYTYLTGNENSGDSTIAVNDASEFSTGDEIIIVQMQNASGGTAGIYEYITISSISGNDITLNSVLTNSYYSGTFNQSSSTSAQIVRVPHYTSVTINSGANITAPAWDGYTGGIVTFRAIGTVTINGAINVSEKGYRGGYYGISSDCDGAYGESWNGVDSSSTCYSYGDNRYENNGGGGSYICGGGGEYGGGATDSDPWTGSGDTYARKGEVYGSADLSRIYFGSGGGGQWDGSDPVISDGGDGGGIIMIYANNITAGTECILAKGQTTYGIQYGSYSYGSSGGAGGSVYLTANTINGITNFTSAAGGLGNHAPDRDGGDGGVGRIRLDYGSLTGTTFPVSGYNGSLIGVDSSNWSEWSNASNPDTSSPWSWNFDFPNSTGYYEFYSIGKKSGSNDELAPNNADAICYYSPPTTPTVITNASTGVEETNATLRGYLNSNGNLDTTCGFRYGTSLGSYSENFSKGTYSSGSEFSNNNGSLTQGQIYFYQAWANNSLGFANGTEMSFLTKPNPPADLSAQSNSTSIIYLTWATGLGANNTYIERNASGVSVWNHGEGTTVYNGSGTYFEETSLAESVTYYYQAWSYANWTYDSNILHQWSDTNASTSNITHDRPSIELVNPVPNGTTEVNTLPICRIWANDSDTSTLDVYWYENTTGSYILRNTNSSVCANSIISYTFTEFSNYSDSYWWKIAVNDSTYNTTEWYYFSIHLINTSVDTITPYIVTYSPYNLTVSSYSDLDKVTLWYQYSSDNISWSGWMENATDNLSPWNWNFNFINGTGYYEFYSIGNKSGSPNETIPGSADAICHFNVTVNNPPIQSNELPANQSTEISLIPQLTITVDDGDLDTLNATWWSNSSGSWVQFASNLSIETISGASNIIQTNSNFSSYLTIYWWSLNLTDGADWTNKTYLFTTESIATSVNKITPYVVTDSQKTITATGPIGLDNVSLWYRYSSTNITWWNESWLSRKPIYLNASSGTTPVNYTVLLNVSYEPGMQSDFDDLRFVNYSDNTTEYDYWIEDKSDGNYANVWLEIREKITTINQTMVWMYYENSDVSTTSNGTNTFPFFDSFDTFDSSTWSATGSYSISSSEITITTGAVYSDSTIESQPDIISEAKVRWNNFASYSGLEIADAQSTSGSNGGSNKLVYLMTNSGGSTSVTAWAADGATSSYNIVSGTPQFTATAGTSYILGHAVSPTQVIFYRDRTITNSYSGTWSDPYYLWLGYFTGSASGSTDISDIVVDWVLVRKYTTSEPTYYIGAKTESWMLWNNLTNPDTSSPWSWSFDFPNGTGYYKFYSIGNLSGSPNETAPSSADAICQYATAFINITPSQWNIGKTSIGGSNESTGFYFNLTNNGSISLDIQIKASNATNTTTGAEWNLSSTPGFDNYTLQYNLSDAGTWTNINLIYDTFVTDFAIDSWQTFDLKVIMATASTKNDPLSITVTFRSVVS